MRQNKRSSGPNRAGTIASRRNPSAALLLALSAWAGLTGPAIGSSSPAPRAAVPQQSDVGSFREEQELLLRQLVRLRQTMELLLARMESEGSTRTVELLRQALTTLDAREAQARTLEEWMKESATSLESGLVLRAVEQQQAAIAELEKLLGILLDRSNKLDLEERLADLAKIKQQLQALTSAERALEKQAEALLRSARDPEQLALEQQAAQLAEAQRQLAAETRSAARASADFEFEWLLRELSELESRAAEDRVQLTAVRPGLGQALEEAQAALGSARAAEGAAASPAQAAKEIAAAETDLAAGQTASEVAADLKESAKAANRAAELAPDEARRAAAKSAQGALERAAAAIESAGQDPSKAKPALQAEVQALAAEARSIAAGAQEARDAAQKTLDGLEATAGSDLATALENAQQALSEARAAAQQRAGDAAPSQLAQLGQQAQSATERAQRAIDGARAAEQSERSELTRSARDSATGANRLDGLLKELQAKNAEQGQADPGLEAAREALQQAAQAAAQGSQELAASQSSPPAAEGQSLEQAREAATATQEALAEARKALESARSAAASSQRDQATLAPLQARQAELQRAAEQLPKPAGANQQQVEQALKQAQEAMQRAASSLSEGRGQAAAQAQQEAAEALEQAAQTSAETPSELNAEQQAEAQRLAAEQRRLQEQILELARLNAEREEAEPSPSMERAAGAAGESAEGLEQGQPEAGEAGAQEAAEELERAQAELEQEERRYQNLRQEELLVEIGAEAEALLTEHRQQIEALRGLDERRSPDEAPSRAVRLGLRRVSQVEQQLSERAAKLATDLEKEQALVFAEFFRAVETDLAVVARDVGESGDYQSGERVLSMQLDVAERLEAVIEALAQERERREKQQRQEEQQQEGGEQQQQPGENRLVPDVAELKLLRRMQVDVQESMDQLVRLTSTGEEIDPLWLQDVQRFAGRHERLSSLFAQFRSRLGLPDPNQPTTEEPK